MSYGIGCMVGVVAVLLNLLLLLCGLLERDCNLYKMRVKSKIKMDMSSESSVFLKL